MQKHYQYALCKPDECFADHEKAHGNAEHGKKPLQKLS
jgi:hypothetical protein